jgi:hypothetical protein
MQLEKTVEDFITQIDTLRDMLKMERTLTTEERQHLQSHLTMLLLEMDRHDPGKKPH